MAKVCPSCELAYSDEDFFCAADGSPLRSTGADADNLVGTVVADRYRVESIIGEGGMGRVYRARHVRVPREAAIKVLRRALIADPYAIAAFNREARNAALVGDHPNVAAVYDFGETADGLVFLAMEFVEGETLAKRLEREPVLPPARAVEIVRQTAAGLTAAHELDEPVVHRDLKPDNILLKATRDGSDWVKVVDFGIAKAIKRETQLLTTPGLVVGTPRYMSPEQLTGGAVDTRSDVYALGMIAFQMLTGRMPFPSVSRDEESTIQWALQRLSTRPLSLAEVRPEIAWPEAAQHALDRALAASATDRFGSANELARALGRAFGIATPASTMGVPDNRTASATLPNVVSTPPRATATSASPVTTRPSESAQPAGSVAPASGRGRMSRATVGVVAGAAVVLAVAGVVWRQALGERPTAPTVAAPADPVARRTDTGIAVQPPATEPPADTVRGGSVAMRADTSASGSTARTPAPEPRPPAAEPAAAPRRPAGSGVIVDDGSRARAALDRLKASLADPDAVAASGSGDAVLRTIARLLPTLSSRTDSVEATYYGVETNLILDRPTEACRMLARIRDASVGTLYEARVERLLSSADLGCANR
jgi:serine/threonine-protein kinase